MPPVALAVVALAVVLVARPAVAAPCAGFTDVDDADPFCTSVAWMKNRGITLGCTATLYCPGDLVTRLQMAAFMYRLGYHAHVQGGGAFGAPAVFGTTDGFPAEIAVSTRRIARFTLMTAADTANVVMGHRLNDVAAVCAGPGPCVAPVGGAVLGGGRPGDENRVTDDYGVVGGGMRNRAGNADADASDAAFATVGGGLGNTASGLYGTVGGGLFNIASGAFSAVVGGNDNLASGTDSVAVGRGARADQDGCLNFVSWFGGGTGTCGNTPNVARFQMDNGLSVDYDSRRPDGGGVRWVHIGPPVVPQTISTWNGAFLSDAGVWTNVSDRAAKDGFAPVDAQAVLEGVVNLPIARWHYRQEGPGVEHIGPTAQDFRAAFRLGTDDRVIGTVDADGVALAAIQGLNARVEAQARVIAAQARQEALQRDEIAAQARSIAAQQAQIAELQRLVARLLAGR